jgi:hypothetical protein
MSIWLSRHNGPQQKWLYSIGLPLLVTAFSLSVVFLFEIVRSGLFSALGYGILLTAVLITILIALRYRRWRRKKKGTRKEGTDFLQ